MPVAAIGAGIGGIGSLLGGLLGSNAASGASAAQVAAAKQAEQYIQGLLAQYNPAVGTSAQTAADMSTQAGAGAVQNMQTQLATNAQNVNAAVPQANALLDPYAQTGAQATTNLQTMMANPLTAQNLSTYDPGYQFRIDQANKALQSSAAARGGALEGGTMSALQAQSQNLASSEYQNAFNRQMAQQQQLLNTANMGMGAANTQGSNLTGAAQFLANQGMTGAQNIGNWMIQPAQYAGTSLMTGAQNMAQNAMSAGQSVANLMSGAGNAQASGIMGAANAWSGALGGVSNAANSYLNYGLMQKLLGNMS